MINKIKESTFRSLLSESLYSALDDYASECVGVENLNEDKVREIVNDIMDELASWRGEINEHGYYPTQFYNLIWDSQMRLIQSWCACRYYQLFDSNNSEFKKEKDTLTKHIDRIRKATLANNNGDKIAMIRKSIVEEMEYDNVENVKTVALMYLQWLEIPSDDNKINQICNDFVENLDDFINVLADKSEHSNDYAYWKFPLK